MTTKQIPKWIDQYLDALGLSLQAPSFQFLESICTAQLTRFPFENISKLIYFRDQQKNGYIIPSDEDFIRNHRELQFGGTCYTQNSKLLNLLRYLGFSCYLAKLGDDHIAILVELSELPNEKLFIDCGAAAPFFTPVRFESDPDNVSQFGSDQVYIKTVDAQQGIYHYVRYRNGKPSGKDWIFHKDKRYEFADFHEIIERANQSNTTFMNILRCQIWQKDQNRNLSLVNNVLTVRYVDGTSTNHMLHSIKDIEEVLAAEFHLPKLPVREAIAVLQDLGVNIFADQDQ